MDKRIILVGLILACLIGNAQAWYNDPGNDSCLTIYADKGSYGVGKIDPRVITDWLVDNQCGSAIADADFGVFLPDEAISEVRFKKVYRFVEGHTETTHHSYTCEHLFDYTRNPNYATCFTYITDTNNGDSEEILTVLWEGSFDSGNLANKTVYWTETHWINGKWRDVTSIFAQAIDARNIPIGRANFTLRFGWKNVFIPAGKTRLKVIFEVPYDYNGRKEFIVAARSKSNHVFVSILNPDWYNVNWLKRMEGVLNTSDFLSGDVSVDHVIRYDMNSDNASFWAVVDSAGADVRFTAADGTTLLPYYLQDFNYTAQTMTANVLVSDLFETAANLTTYIYYSNSGASDAQDPTAVLGTNYLAVYHADEGTGTAVNDKLGDFNATASDSTIWSANSKIGAADLNGFLLYDATQGTLIDTMPTNLAASLWFNPSYTLDSGLSTYITLTYKKNDNSPANYLYTNFTPTGAYEINMYVDGGYKTATTSQISWTADTWHHVIYSWTTSRGMEIFINGAADGASATATTLMSNADPPNASDYYLNGGVSDIFPGMVDEHKVMKIGITADEAALLYRSENLELIKYGAEEIPPSEPVISVWQIEGFDFNAAVLPVFSYAKDGNLTTTFHASDAESDDLNFNMFWDLVTGGKANKIIGDINLSTDSRHGSCDTNAKTGMTCTWDWNTMGITDENYWITIELNDGSAATSGSGAKSFLIDNTAPTVSYYYPAADEDTLDSSPTFVVWAIDTNSQPSQVWYGFYYNGIRDYNGSADFNSDGAAVMTYIALEEEGDTIFLVVNKLTDSLLNEGKAVTATASFSFVPERMRGVDPEHVEDTDLISAMQYGLFGIFTGIAGSIVGIILIILAGLLMFMVFKVVKG